MPTKTDKTASRISRSMDIGPKSTRKISRKSKDSPAEFSSPRNVPKTKPSSEDIVTSRDEARSYWQKIGDMNEFQRKVQKLTHVAVCRRMSYFHHYLVLDLFKGGVRIIHYKSEKNIKLFSLAEVQEEDLYYSKEDSDLFDFHFGLYIIKRPEYPSTENAEKIANERALSRQNETNYTISFNNCEHLVTWILTGNATCEQLKGARQRFVADLIDTAKGTTDHNALFNFFATFVVGITNNLSIIAKDYIAIAQASAQVNNACEAIFQAFPEATNFQTIQGACQAYELLFDISVAAKNDVYRSFVDFFILTVLIELLTAVGSIYNLYKHKKKCDMNTKQFHREITKTLGNFIGTFVGSFVPIPVVGSLVGGAIGGVLGSLLGRIIGSAAAGKAFDAIIGQ